MSLLRSSNAARFLLLAALLLPFARPAAAQSSADIATMVSLLHANNYNYQTTKSPSVWVIHFTGNHLKDIKVVLAIGEEPEANIVVFVTVVEKRRMPVTTDFMRVLLEQNHKVDRTKICFDADGDLSVRTDAALRVTDAKEFEAVVRQVKNVSDELYGLIEPQLLP
jgi:hypothetical protein